MPNFVQVTDEELDSIEDDGGLSKGTRMHRARDYTPLFKGIFLRLSVGVFFQCPNPQDNL